MHNLLCNLIIVLFCFSTLAQQGNNYKFKRISEDQGLSNNWVRAFHQDETGFIWIGTADGLNRFDGYQCKTYRPVSDSGIVFGNIAINDISKKSKNELWVSTSNGLYTFKNNRLEFFKKLKRVGVSEALNENDSITWVASMNGVIRLNQKSNSVIDYNLNTAHKFYKRKVQSMHKDSKGNIWFGATGIVFKYNIVTQHIEEYTAFENLDTQTKNDILSITEDQSGIIWIGFGQNGVYYLNPENQSKLFKKYSEGVIINLHVDKDNQLWIGKGSNKGLEKIDLNNKQRPITFRYDINDPNSISDSSIFSVYEDREGDIWIGTFGGGVNYSSKRDKNIYTLKPGSKNSNSIQNGLVNSVVEDNEYIWIGTEGGLERLNKKNNKIKHYEYEDGNDNSLSRDPIQIIYKDSRDNLWIGIWDGGLNRYNPITDNFIRYKMSENKESKQSENVLAILEDSKKRLWIGTSGKGLYQYNYETDSFKAYVHDPQNPNSIPSNSITQLLETNDEQILFATYHSINFFDPENLSFTNHIFSIGTKGEATSVLCTYMDSQNKVWVGTSVGLYIFDRITEKFIPFESKGQITNVSVKSIIEDDNQHIWVSTTSGLFEIDEYHQKINKLTKQDGLTSNDFKGKSAYKNGKGVLYFGTSKGLNYFHPSELITNKSKPNMAITSFAVLQSTPNENKRYQSIIENPNIRDEISLSHEQNSFVVSFTGLNYLHPEKNEYRYKLEGYDEVWVDAGNNLNATYTNVNSGIYTFKVKGANNDSIWNDTIKTLVLKINSPWYDTTVFKIFCIAFLICIILTFYFVRVSFFRKQGLILKEKVLDRTKELSNANQLLKENKVEIEQQNLKLANQQYHLEELVNKRTLKLQEAKIKAEESDRLKSAFVANMSHEIRTPMNAIYGFSNLLNDENITNKERVEYVEIINQSCESLLVLIDDILDISILEAKGTKLILNSINVHHFLSKLEKIYKQKETNTLSVRYEYNQNQVYAEINTDEVRLKQILTNLLNNAVKFTEKGIVSFGFTIENNHIIFYVRDTGIGITDKDLEVIFDPFLKAGNHTKKVYRGTGIGLSISEKLVNTFKGEIKVDSSLGKGSTFYVKIPTNIA